MLYIFSDFDLDCTKLFVLFFSFSFLLIKVYKVQGKIKFARIPLCACAQNCVWGLKMERGIIKSWKAL